MQKKYKKDLCLKTTEYFVTSKHLIYSLYNQKLVNIINMHIGRKPTSALEKMHCKKLSRWSYWILYIANILWHLWILCLDSYAYPFTLIALATALCKMQTFVWFLTALVFASSHLWHIRVDESVFLCLKSSNEMGRISSHQMALIYHCISQRWQSCREVSSQCYESTHFPCGILQHLHESSCLHSEYHIWVGIIHNCKTLSL